MKRELFLVLSLVALVILAKNHPNKRSPSVSIPTEVHLHTATRHHQAVVVQEVQTSASAVSLPEKKIDLGEEPSEQRPGLPRGMRYLPKVKAIDSTEYKESLGPKLLIKNNLTFFRSQNAEGLYTHVVYDARRETYHPLTATLKLTEVDQQKREENLKRFDEFYYHPELEIQYVQSSHQHLWQDYQAAQEAHLNPQLEVVVGLPIPK